MSGNPNGRPKGTGLRQQLFANLVEPHKEALFETAINLALDGNEAMLRLFLERLIPAKPVDDSIAIPMPIKDGHNLGTLSIWGETVLKTVWQGEITPDQANTIMTLIDAQRKNIEASDLSSRLVAIERELKQRKEGQ